VANAEAVELQIFHKSYLPNPYAYSSLYTSAFRISPKTSVETRFYLAFLSTSSQSLELYLKVPRQFLSTCLFDVFL
jgi:hypothetical protein